MTESPVPPGRRPHGVFVAAFLATLLYVLLSQHLLPSGDFWGPRAGPFTDLFAAAGTPTSPGFVAANRRLQQRLDDFERRLEDRIPPAGRGAAPTFSCSSPRPGA